MQLETLLQIIIKAIGIYLLYVIGMGLLPLLTPIFLSQPISLITLHLLNLIIPIIFAYVFLVKPNHVTKWLTSQQNDKIQIAKSDYIYLLILASGIISLLWGLKDGFKMEYSRTENLGLNNSFSYNINFQIGNIILIILGCIVLVKREKISTYFSHRTGIDSEKENM